MMGSATPATLLLFWDYDTQWGGDRSRTPGGAKEWGRLEFQEADRLLELHAEYGVPACFAVVGSAALPGEHPYHDPAQIRRIHEAGHEVASHSFRHDWIPGLSPGELRESLTSSKKALEDCIGAQVVSFVPPYNQPYDYPGRMAFSISERREAGRVRTDLAGLCEGLRDTGYQFCRVTYRTLGERVHDAVRGKAMHRPTALETIRGIRCARMNATGGFNDRAHAMLDRCVKDGGITVVGGHPHSLHAGNSQDEKYLVPFLARAREYHREGRLRFCVPRDLLGGTPR
jgi:hypothetical protein